MNKDIIVIYTAKSIIFVIYKRLIDFISLRKEKGTPLMCRAVYYTFCISHLILEYYADGGGNMFISLETVLIGIFFPCWLSVTHNLRSDKRVLFV